MIEPQTTYYLEKLKDADWRVRKSAVLALGPLGDPAVVPALAASLTDAFPSVRAFAAIELGKCGEASAVPALIAALQDEEWIVRKNVVRALLKIDAPSAVPALLERLSEEDEGGIRALLAFELGKRGEIAVVPTLVEMLQSEERSVRAEAAVVLADLGVPAVGTLLQYLTHRPIQKAVADVLWKMGDATVLPRKILADRRLTARDRITVLEKLRRARPNSLDFYYKFAPTRDLCLAVLKEENADARAGAQTVLNWLNGERHLIHASQSEPEYDLLLRASPDGYAEIQPETLLRGAVEPPENTEPLPRLSPWQRLFGKR